MTEPTHACYRPSLAVNLGALRENYRRIRALAGAEAGAVVKADAYGVGLEAAAAALREAGCRTFFTAFAGEGARIRAGDGTAEIFVLSPLVQVDAPLLIAESLVPCLYDLADAEQWLAATGSVGAPAPAALHFETGINRLGLPADAAAAFGDPDGPHAGLSVRLVLTHLACSDDPGAVMNAEQRERFAAVAAAFPGVRASLSNSGGIFLGREYHFDLVRPGVCLFGHDPHHHRGQRRMRTVASLRAALGQVKQLSAGQSIGYGADFVCERPMRVGVGLAGYADGVPRSLSHPGGTPVHFAIEGYPVRLLGRVSMDMVVVDLDEVPEPIARPGAELEIFGENVPIETIAARAGTIPYELLTGVGRRVARIYRS